MNNRCSGYLFQDPLSEKKVFSWTNLKYLFVLSARVCELTTRGT